MWIVSANAATVSSAVGMRQVYIDDGQTDGAFQFTIANSAGNAGLLMRWIDANNAILTVVSAGTIRLRRLTGGVQTNLGTGGAAAAGDTVKVTVTGNTWELFLNGVSQFTATESQGNTSTKHGMQTTATTPKLDDYSHKSA